MKDKDIENKINKEIKEKCKNIVSDKQNVYTTVYANFSNILSGGCFSDKHVYFNYDLTTGNKLTIEDLFTNSTNIYSVIGAMLNHSIAMSIGYGEFDEENGYNQAFDENDYSKIEDRVLQLINEVKKGNYKFYVKHDGITVLVDNEYANISVMEYAPTFAYFNRFKTETSIYDNSYIGEKDFLVTVFYNSGGLYFAPL